MEWSIIAVAGFLGGALNALAGGGSFITLPALVFVGLSPVSANATGTAALLPGYIASAWRFRRDIELPANLNLSSVTVLALSGGALGSLILLFTSEEFFSKLIPWLILLATVVFVVGPRAIEKKAKETHESQTDWPVRPEKRIVVGLLLFIICIYGGYFNGGLGIIFLATMSVLGTGNLHNINGAKNLVSALLTVISVAVYAGGGMISFGYLTLLGISAAFGGYCGASIGYHVPQTVLRYFIILTGFTMSLLFFLR